MRKLAMYSDQIPPLTNDVDRELLLLLTKLHPTIGYISSSADPSRKYFKERWSYYFRLGMDLRVYFELDREYRSDLLDMLFSCDAIHLSGGDTRYFLRWLRERKMIEPLRRYVDRGGVLIGVSAGSIIMGPDISVSALDPNDPADSDADLSSLNMVDFVFAPHFGSRPSQSLPVLEKFSHDRRKVVYACKDSGGIVVDGDDVRCIGDVLRIDAR